MVPAIPQLAPETPVLPSAEGVPALPGEVLEELPSGMPQAELEARIRHRLEALTQQAASEEALLTEQLRERIQQYVRERPRDAARLVKLLMGE
jgi:flagellar biosynthesis/type III secretory pathway M-ring protein FliF/YscJ